MEEELLRHLHIFEVSNKIKNNSQYDQIRNSMKKFNNISKNGWISKLGNPKEAWKKSDSDDLHELVSCITKFYKKNPSRKGQNPLHFVASMGNIKLFMKICEDDPNPNPNDDLDVTPFHLAAMNGHLTICEFILEHIKDKNPKEKLLLQTPLHFAAKDGYFLVCQLIMKNIVDENTNLQRGKSPFRLVLQAIFLRNVFFQSIFTFMT